MAAVKEHYSLGEAADILGISYEALASRCRRGTVTYTRIGRWRYVSGTVLEMLAPGNWSRYSAKMRYELDE